MSGPTPTASLRFEKQFTGENVNTWGIHLDTLFDLADTAIAGMLSVAITGDTVLTSVNYASDQSRYAAIKFTGSPAAACTITIPSVTKLYRLHNATTVPLTITTGAGTTFAIAVDDVADCYCDASNVIPQGYSGLSIKDYIASVAFSASGALPAQLGNAGRFVKTDGTNASWQFVASTDLSDYSTFLGRAVALAVAL